MNETWKKTIMCAVAAVLLIVVGYYLGVRTDVHGIPDAAERVDSAVEATQREQQGVEDAIGRAEQGLDSAQETTDRIADSNRRSDETAERSGTIIERLEQLLGEIQGQQSGN